MGRGNESLYNAISIIFLVLTAIVIIVFAVMGITGGSADSQGVLPTVRVLPSATDTPIPPTATYTAVPTETYTPTPTDTPTSTSTLRPTNIPSSTPVPSPTITPTLSATPTLDVTLTNTPTATATGPSPTAPPALPFAGPDQPQFTRNFANSAGCAWQGVGGQVLALSGAAFTNPLQVHVYSTQQDFGRVSTGTNQFYGASGFEMRVANSINRLTYFVQLESRSGVAISEVLQVTFPGDCEQNAAIINFQQVRSLNP